MNVIYEEYCLREERGETVADERFCEQYAERRESIAKQLYYHHIFNSSISAAEYVARMIGR